MSRKTWIALSFTLILLLAFGGSALAQGPGDGWQTGFFVTNKEAAQATVLMQFYKENSGTALPSTPISKNIAANDTVFYFLPGSDFSALGSGEYSVVLSSDKAVNAVANSTSSGGSAGAGQTNSTTSFDGISGDATASSATAAKLFIPNAYSNFFGFVTNFYVQNASGANTTVDIKFFDAAGAEIASLAETGVSIPAGSFIKRDQAGKTAIATNTVGSATIECKTTDCKLAGVVNISDTRDNIGTSNYVMFGSGSTVVNAPVALNNYFGFSSSINVQNVGTAGAVDVEIVFSDGTKTSKTGIAQGQAWSVFLPNDVANLASGNTNGALAATINVLNPETGDAIVGLVNTSSTGQAFASYNGVSGGATKVFASASNAKAFGSLSFFTSITCQNLSATATDLKYTFSGVNTNSSNTAVSATANMSAVTGAPTTLAKDQSFVLLLNVDSVLTNLGLPSGFNGATTIEATAAGAQIACVVNQNRTTGGLPGDNLGAYTARP